MMCVTYSGEFVLFRTSLKISAISSFVRGGSVCNDGGSVTITLGMVNILCTDEGSPNAMMSVGRSGLLKKKTMKII